MQKSLKSKTVSAIMAVLMILSHLFAFPLSVQAAGPIPYPGDVVVKSIQAGQILVKLNGGIYHDFNFDYIAYDNDGKTWPAYCLEPVFIAEQACEAKYVNEKS